jgi:uncharacterized membrane protein
LHNKDYIYIKADDWGNTWIWQFLRLGEKDVILWPFYPLIPWAGVMAAGYGFGTLCLLPQERRRKEFIGLGLMLTFAFIALRYFDLYGDMASHSASEPGPWSERQNLLYTVFSFVNCQKYPPSLLFLLMTLGPGIAAMGLWDRPLGGLGRFFVTFGRVPLFFYLLHWYLLKGIALAIAYARFGRGDWLFREFPDPRVPPQTIADQMPPEGNGFDLWVVYLIWIGMVLFLYPFCYWFAGVKARRRDAWLSYL